MNNTETAKLKVEIEGDEADKTLLSLQSEAKEINKALRDMKAAGEEGSDAWKELKLRQKEVSEEIRDMVKNVDLNNASMAELQASSRLLNRELRDLKVGSDEWIDKMKEVQEVDSRIESVRKEVRGLKDDAEEQTGVWSSFKAGFAGAFTFEAIKEAAEALYDFGQDVLETTAKFEKYNAILETTLGSSEAGAAAFQMLQEFAAKTNFGVDELTDSYIKLANRGLRPGQDELMKMADVSNATGHTMLELTEAINDINNTDRWNNIGIKCQTMGDQVQLSFKGMTQTVDRTEEGVMKAVAAFGEMEGVVGMTTKISETLDGQLSNMEDNFDRLKTTVGGDSTDAFKAMIGVGNELIDAFIDIWKGTTPLREGLSDVVDVGVRFGQSIETLIRTLFGYDDKAKGTTIVVDAITVAFRLVGGVLIAAVSAVGTMVDALSILMNKGKEVANFFGADFKINPKANFDTLKDNMDKNAKAIDKLWSDNETKREETTKKADANILNNTVKSQQTITAEAKKEAEKKAQAVEKAEADSLKKIQDMQVKAIADEQTRKIAEINLHYDREDAAIKKSVASQKTKDEQLALSAKERETKINQTEEDFRKKKEKADADTEAKLDALRIKMIADESARKIAELNAQYARDKKYIDDHITDTAKHDEAIKLLNDKLTLDITAVNDKHRADELQKNNKKRDDEFRATKQLFDNEFKEAVALSDAKLVNAKDNANAIYQAKLDRLQAEWNYNRQKLQQEAAEEKAKNEAMIQDADRRANANKAIDDRLKAQLTANDVKYESDKSRLLDENLAKRKANTDQFFSAVESAMDGDYTKFMEILNKKLKNDSTANDDRLKNFSKSSVAILDIAKDATDTLMKLNQTYLDSQLAKIKKEKDAELAKVKELYDKGLLSKEEYESKTGEINAKYAAIEKEEKLKAWRRQQALAITQAIIGGAQAAIMSLATMGWPLGLIGVAAAAVAVATQVSTIKKQQPPDYAKGGKGYVKNAGVVKGDRHGSRYGDAGIVMTNRRTGEEVGEMEGDEPFMILSRNTYKNNKPVVDMLLHSSLHRNGAPIYGNGGTYGDFVGRTPSFGKGGLGGRKMYVDGGMDSIDDGSGIQSSPQYQDASTSTEQTQAQIEKSQRLMDDIATNTENTVMKLKDIQAFLAGPFLTTLQNQSDEFSSNIKGQVGSMVGEQKTANGFLATIAAKDLSVSVHNVVNVMNQINVVINKSDFQ
ncbi:hypothetical protein [Spirosoma endbachense]|uniref:Phage tail tape measure protein domain-containing protein n=1 Tax=Spirosoma endbachense TaxID=2666025 RepID=A0A6P1W1N8_9BACT|nr:hypothetical protein [Spirosoma endbachense]QHV97937.1 hypothetical protein GJR95_24305 [Spirosoma endbachense]